VKEAKEARIIGSNANQNDIAPDQTLGSVVIDLPHAFLLIAREVRKGGFTGKVFSLGLHDSVVTYVPNPRLSTSLPAGLLSSVDSARKQMIAGSFGKKLLPDSSAIAR